MPGDNAAVYQALDNQGYRFALQGSQTSPVAKTSLANAVTPCKGPGPSFDYGANAYDNIAFHPGAGVTDGSMCDVVHAVAQRLLTTVYNSAEAWQVYDRALKLIHPTIPAPGGRSDKCGVSDHQPVICTVSIPGPTTTT